MIFINYIIRSKHVSDKNVQCHPNSYYNHTLPDPRSLSPFFNLFWTLNNFRFRLVLGYEQNEDVNSLRFIPEII